MSRRNRHRRGVSRWPLAERVGAAVAGAAAVWWGVDLIWGDLNYVGYINAFGLWWALAAAVAGVWLLWRRRWGGAAAIALACAIAVQGFALNIGAFAAAPTPQAEGSFRLITASLRNQNNDMAGAVSTLLEDHPDILIIQEADVNEFIDLLNATSGSNWNYVSSKNEIIACLCPVTARREQNRILSAEVVLANRAVRVWNVRAPKYYDAPQRNAAYFYALATQVRGVDTGIIAGDFNATPWNDGYNTIARTARDAWKEAGFGPGLTFSSPARRWGVLMPLVSIDHVFLKGKLRATKVAVRAASNGADHFPIVADIVQP